MQIEAPPAAPIAAPIAAPSTMLYVVPCAAPSAVPFAAPSAALIAPQSAVPIAALLGVIARWIPSKAIRCPTVTASHMYMLQSTCASKAAMDTTMQHYVFASSTLPWELAARFLSAARFD
eukprot:GHVR01096984.1.p2 GENE.GHVR01096984.1~~GHVR01096984.1.p2  ORF type:complete len:120 (+),score=14.69 GHVR01096984.1:376-735(+)